MAHDLIAQNKVTNKTVIVAQSQSAGRGRYKRKWVSNNGNLYASFIYKISERDPKLSYAIAVAVAETIQPDTVLIKYLNYTPPMERAHHADASILRQRGL